MKQSSLVTIDFEASCLGPYSYPIEVGIARWDGPGSPIRTWSTLIIPTQQWIAHGDWTWEAQQIHGIAPQDLAQGLSPHAAVAGLKTMAEDAKTAICDGGEHDLGWLVRLTMASGHGTLPFGLQDFDNMTMSLSSDGYARMTRHLEENKTPHRAGPDAVRLLQAYLIGLTGHPETVQIVNL